MKRSGDNKKLVFLSRKVLEEVQMKTETTGTKIAFKILEIYKDRDLVSETNKRNWTSRMRKEESMMHSTFFQLSASSTKIETA
jgi:hypothetical protein